MLSWIQRINSIFGSRSGIFAGVALAGIGLGVVLLRTPERIIFINAEGRCVFALQVNDASKFQEGFCAVRRDDLWGYIDKEGRFLVRPQYYKADDFSDGLARVLTIGWRTKYLDRKGEPATPTFETYDSSSFSEGVASIRVGRKMGYIGSSGNLVIPTRFDDAKSFHESLASVKDGEKWGYIDRTGQYVIAPKFDDAGTFSEGLAAVKVGSKWGYIDPSGRYVIAPQFHGALAFSEGMAAVRSPYRVRDGRLSMHVTGGWWGFLDRNGAFIIEPQFADATAFSNGIAAVSIGDRQWGFVDKAGILTVGPRFFWVRPFANGVAPVAVNGDRLPPNWGYIDKAGQYWLKPRFLQASEFSEGLAWVKVKRPWWERLLPWDKCWFASKP